MESTASCPAVVSTVQLTRRSTAYRVRKMLIPLGAMGFQARLWPRQHVRASRWDRRTTSTTCLKIATSNYYVGWNQIQQNVHISGNCGLQFTDNLGTAVAKGLTYRPRPIWGRTSPSSCRRATTTPASPRTRSAAWRWRERPSRERRDQLCPGHEPPVDDRVRPAIQLQVFRSRRIRPRRLGIHQPQPLARARAGSEQQQPV